MEKLLIFVLLSISAILACDYPTFKNASVTVLGVRGVDKISGCLEPDGVLEKASYVQIINETIPVLYQGSIRNLPNLADVILDNNGIIEINSGAFYNLPKLRLLRLKDNRVEVVKTGVFTNLTISELNLMNNSISVIELGAFNDMPKLGILNLDNNKLTIWQPDWFLNSPQINTLSFKHNQIKSVPKSAFKHIRGLHTVNGRNVTTNIYLEENEIETVDPEALLGLDLVGWLFLSRNRIEVIDEGLLEPLGQIDWLKLSHNRLSCVPDKVVEKIPTVVNYLDGNPLSEGCRDRITKKV